MCRNLREPHERHGGVGQQRRLSGFVPDPYASALGADQSLVRDSQRLCIGAAVSKAANGGSGPVERSTDRLTGHPLSGRPIRRVSESSRWEEAHDAAERR